MILQPKFNPLRIFPGQNSSFYRKRLPGNAEAVNQAILGNRFSCPLQSRLSAHAVAYYPSGNTGYVGKKFSLRLASERLQQGTIVFYEFEQNLLTGRAARDAGCAGTGWVKS